MRIVTAPLSWKLSLLAVLLVAAPGVGLAAEAPAPDAEQSHRSEVPESLHLMEPPPESEGVHGALRVLAELGLVSGVAPAVGMAGFFAGFLLSASLGSGMTPDRALEGALYGFSAGFILGAPLGAWSAGKLTGGRGTYLGALWGTGVGAGAGAVMSLLVTHDDMKPFFIPLFSVVGAIVGYEVSHAMNKAPRAATSASFQPVLTVSDRHAALGLSGRF